MFTFETVVNLNVLLIGGGERGGGMHPRTEGSRSWFYREHITHVICFLWRCCYREKPASSAKSRTRVLSDSEASDKALSDRARSRSASVSSRASSASAARRSSASPEPEQQVSADETSDWLLNCIHIDWSNLLSVNLSNSLDWQRTAHTMLLHLTIRALKTPHL